MQVSRGPSITYWYAETALAELMDLSEILELLVLPNLLLLKRKIVRTRNPLVILG